MTRLLVATILLAAITLTGCKTKKDTITVNPKQPGGITTVTTPTDTLSLPDRLEFIANRQATWQTLQAGGNVKLGGAKSLAANMQLRMVRDKAIYISIRVLGIEAAKIIVDNDSVLLVDKFHKRYLAEPVSMLTNGLPATVGMVQDIFLGRAFLLNSGTLNNSNKRAATITSTEAGNARIQPEKQPEKFAYNFDINTRNNIIALNVIPQKGTPYKASYSEIQNTLAGPIAHQSLLQAHIAGADFTLRLEMKNLQWNTAFKIDTSRPGGNYKRITPKQLGSMFDRD